MLITTVVDKANSFSNADYAQAVLARKIQKIIGRPTTRAFIYFIENNLLPNCPVNRRDVLRAEQIFGPDIGALKGKTVRQQPPCVQVDEVTVPPTIQQHYQDVTLACDIMYVNKIPFLMSISRHIRFGTAQHIKINKERQSSVVYEWSTKSTYNVVFGFVMPSWMGNSNH